MRVGLGKGYRTIARAIALTTVSAGALCAPHAMAQEAEQTDPQSVPESGEGAADVVVVGIRGSVQAAADRKRTAKQIVESVVSEDVGKLPDNNVPEALSRVTGVQIDRARGQGQGLTIRGLDQVQTTINGNQTNSGQDRSINLADVPAELLKSVEVYKTRTADQVEGGIAGTVNIELRRPLDLKKGLTLAGSVRGVYDDISEKVSPYASILVGDRFETGIGEMGFLINGSWTKTKYLETYIESESPARVVCCTETVNGVTGPRPNTPLASLTPEQAANLIIPYRAYTGTERGYSERPSINLVGQWRASPNLDFVLEGGYIGARERRETDRLFVQTKDTGSLSNIVVAEDGRTVVSLTNTNPDGVLAGLEGIYNALESNLYTSNFEAHWRSDRAQINFSAQYNWSNDSYYFVQDVLRLRNQTSVNVNFDSDIYQRGAPSIDFGATDLSNIDSYLVDRFQDNRGDSRNKEFATQLDLTLKLSEGAFLRSLQTGVRFNVRNTHRFYGYRDGFPRVNGAMAPLSGFPGADGVVTIAPAIDGTAPVSWLNVPTKSMYDNIDAIRAYIQANDPGSAARFASEFPLGDIGQTWDSNENIFAGYAQVNYAFDALGFPIDGVAGVRYTNTWGAIESYDFRTVPGQPDFVQRARGEGNYVDVLPSASAILHFDPKLQLRLSYSTNVSRPGFYAMRPFAFINTNGNPIVVDAGNPDLKAQREHSYNASLEYYFGRAGSISLAGYYKKATGFLYWSRETGQDLTRYGFPGQTGIVAQERNAGDGTFAGVEFAAQTFFDFLPDFWRNFGASVNASYVGKARVEYPFEEAFPGAFDSPNTSKWTANAALYYDSPTFSTRVAYNYRSSYRMGVFSDMPEYSPYNASTQRLDAAINVTPWKFVTLSLEGTNLLGDDVYRYHGQQELLPLGVRTLARTVQASARFRF